MKIAYCTNVRLPSERAHGHQVAAVTDALALLGHEVTIFAPYRKNTVTQSYHDYYRSNRAVQIRHLGSFDPIASPFLPGVLGLWFLNWSFRKKLKTELHNFDLLYTRSPALLPTLIASNIPTVLELHQLPRTGRKLFVSLCNRCRLIVCLTSPMKKELASWGVTAKTIVEGDAVDLHAFSDANHASPAPSGIPLIVYTGQLQSMGLSKGIPELLSALQTLSDKAVRFHAIVAGGPDAAKKKFEASLSPTLRSHVTFAGHLPHAEIPSLLSVASVLVYPAPKSDHPFYNRDTSPLKLFEYAASGKPIVSADLPPIRDVFDDTMLTFVLPGDSAALASAIQKVLSSPEESKRKAHKARAVIENHTWDKRMERILASVQSIK